MIQHEFVLDIQRRRGPLNPPIKNTTTTVPAGTEFAEHPPGGGGKMEKTMRAAVMTGVGKIEMQTRPMPVPKTMSAGENPSRRHLRFRSALLRTRPHRQLCGGRAHDPRARERGRGCRVRRRVTGFAVGDRVAIEPGWTCGTCEYCRSGGTTSVPTWCSWPPRLTTARSANTWPIRHR